MPEGVIAVCGDRREPTLKRVLIDDAFFEDIASLFYDQEEAFRHECYEVPFGGTWRADADEIVTLPLPRAAQVLGLLPSRSETALDTMEARNIADEAIRGLVVAPERDKVLVQKYYDSQTMLPGRFLIPGVDGLSFRRTDSSALTFDKGLVCVIEDDLLKFKSLAALSRVIDTTEIFREATDEEIEEFKQHPLIDIVDPDGFDSSLNQVFRKLIYGIQSGEMLANRTIGSLQQAASQTGFPLNVRGERIQMPAASGDIKALLRFLNDDIYIGAISGANFMTNSKRPR